MTVWPPPAKPQPDTRLRCLPRITVRQLNRRGACLDQVTRFRMRFGRIALITPAACAAACHDFDFEWAADELLHDPHADTVWQAVQARIKLPGYSAADYHLVVAEEFARIYLKVYPNVP